MLEKPQHWTAYIAEQLNPTRITIASSALAPHACAMRIGCQLGATTATNLVQTYTFSSGADKTIAESYHDIDAWHLITPLKLESDGDIEVVSEPTVSEVEYTKVTHTSEWELIARPPVAVELLRTILPQTLRELRFRKNSATLSLFVE